MRRVVAEIEARGRNSATTTHVRQQETNTMTVVAFVIPTLSQLRGSQARAVGA